MKIGIEIVHPFSMYNNSAYEKLVQVTSNLYYQRLYLLAISRNLGSEFDMLQIWKFLQCNKDL